jgi:hypothetical protein
MDRCRLLLLVMLASSLACASDASPSAHPVAQANDNRLAAGELKRGVLTVQLEMVEATWYPEQEGGPSLSVYAFAEKGGSPKIPGPLLRIPEGTEVHAQIHNALPVAMFIRGLRAHDTSVRPRSRCRSHGRFSFHRPNGWHLLLLSPQHKMSLREIGVLSILTTFRWGPLRCRVN